MYLCFISYSFHRYDHIWFSRKTLTDKIFKLNFYFEILVDSHIVIRNNAESPCTPIEFSLIDNTAKMQCHSTQCRDIGIDTVKIQNTSVIANFHMLPLHSHTYSLLPCPLLNPWQPLICSLFSSFCNFKSIINRNI